MLTKNTSIEPFTELHQVAFNNSFQANIITTVSNGNITLANKAACKLLGYTKKEILNQNPATIFDTKESSFKKMIKTRKKSGQSSALVTAFKKNGKPVQCEITSAVFKDKADIENSIYTISDLSQSILLQKNIDIKKDKVIAKDIFIAKTKQKKIDLKKDKVIANDIFIAKTKQKEIDKKKEKIVVSDTRRALKKSGIQLAENNEWIKYIAETSYDVMWDWNIAGGEIYVGESIKEIFGYAVKNNTVLYTDFIRCLVPTEKDNVEKKLMKTLASIENNWSDSFRFKHHNGTIANTTSRACIVRDEKGNAMRLIGALHDISRLHELEKTLEQQNVTKIDNNDLTLKITKLPFDRIWDWNLLTNEFYLGDGYEVWFGEKNIKDKHFDWRNYLHPEDKDALEKDIYETLNSSSTQWEYKFRFIIQDGSIINVLSRASIIRQRDGKAYRLIGTVQELKHQNELEEKLRQEITIRKRMETEYEENFKLIFNSSSDILYDVDIVAGEVVLSDAYEREFGYVLINNKVSIEEWFNRVHEDDKEFVLLDYYRMLASDETEWKQSFRYLKADSSIANVVTKGIILRNNNGEPYRRIGYMQDISKQKVLEEKLQYEIDLKESQIEEASEEAKEIERSDIGKELHDNVNQLLGASRLYLEMAKKGGNNSKDYLSRSSEYTLTAMEEIRKLSKGLTSDFIKNLGLSESLNNISNDIMEVHEIKIKCNLESFIEASVNDKFKLNVYRIVQEQLNNILKHAKAKEASINLSQDKKTITLSISDDGIGFVVGQQRKGIGITNIKGRAKFYKTTADFNTQPGKGCVLTINFPITDVLRAN